MEKKRILQLLKKTAQQDADAFFKLYTEVSPLVFSVALSLLKNMDDANDTVQDVFIKLYNISAKNIPTSNPIGWIYSISKNMAMENLRKIKKEHHTNIDDLSPFIGNQTTEVPSDVFSLLSCLSPEESEIVILKVIYKYTHKEISQLIHLPQGTVQWKYKLALAKIRDSLSNERY